MKERKRKKEKMCFLSFVLETEKIVEHQIGIRQRYQRCLTVIWIVDDRGLNAAIDTAKLSQVLDHSSYVMFTFFY